jgi:hypothetical protein
MKYHFATVIFIVLIIGSVDLLLAQAQEQRDYQRWGKFGVGKLVTTQNNLNNIGDGQMRWPQWAHHPAMEYPYNPEPGGRHIMYALGMSFHIGGFCEDYGPTFNPSLAAAGDDPTLTARVESADRTYYRYYDGFHFEGFPEFVADYENASIPVSNDTTTWPENGWPAYYPTRDWYHDSRYPDYQNAYQLGMGEAVPLLIDPKTGWPGAGKNGELLADQESFSVNFSRNREYMEDPDTYDGKLMVYTTLRGLSFGGDFYDDFLIYIWVVTNIAQKPITGTYLGMLVDFDFPWASYAGFSSYNKTDCYAYDSEQQMAYGWDGDGEVPGTTYGDWPHPQEAKLTDESVVSNPSLIGVKFLQTPKDNTGMRRLGVTSFDAFNFHIKDSEFGIGSSHWELYNNNIVNRSMAGHNVGWDPDDINHDQIDDWTWEHPYPMGNEGVYVRGYRSEFTINTGPFTLEPGESDTLIIAVVAGESRDALFKNAGFAEQLYISGWKPVRPPLEPLVRVEEGSGAVKLIWDNHSEDDLLNSLSDRQPFEGYKLYRSSDGGQTWGTRFVTDENGSIVDYVPDGQWDLINGIKGASSIIPTFNQGKDNGLDEIIEIAHKDTTILEMIDGDTVFYGEFIAGDTTGRRIYIDRNVIDGFRYRYAVCAYSADGKNGEPPVQNSRNVGSQNIDEVPNVVSVIPHAENARSTSDLDKIKVVPNPYRVIAEWEMSQDERMIKFTHLPAECTIKIFNVAGELMRTLKHDLSSPIDSEEIWNLRTDENREVAPGLYFYYLQSNLGEKSGKFVIIK